MHLFAKSYPRHHPAPAAAPAPTIVSSTTPQKRVRVARGVLLGLTGRVVSAADPRFWLIEADQPGLLVRISPALLEPLPRG